MKKIEVESSRIESIAYDENSKVLEINFIEGGTYQYVNVKVDVFEAFLEAESKSEFFLHYVKNKYQYEKIDF